MTSLSSTATLGALVAERPSRAELLERLGLDYCCGGAQTLEQACGRRGLDPDTVRQLLEALDDRPLAPSGPLEDFDARRASIPDLCEHIVAAHHDTLRRELPRLGDLLATVVRVHGAGHRELHDLERLFAGMRAELEAHIEVEERVLFPACRAADDGAGVDAGFERLLSRHEAEHADAGDAAVALRELTGGFDAAGAFCNTHRSLLDGLHRFELELHQHVHEENNVLFPRVRALVAA